MNATIRHNPYTLIHKGLWACMTDVLVIVGRIDPRDADDVATAAKAVRAMLDFARSHLQHEEDWIHTALEARRTGKPTQRTTDGTRSALREATETSTRRCRNARTSSLRMRSPMALSVAWPAAWIGVSR